MADDTRPEAPRPGLRFYLGIAVFALGWLMPAFIPLVAITGLSIEWKAAISGVLLIGGPEVFSLLAIALLGRDGFNYIKAQAFGLFRRYGPPRRVSRSRYRFGLVMFVLPIVFSYFIFYAPDLIPGYRDHRIALNVAADLLLVSSFFVLGGDFWDKFRALFVYDAKAHFGTRTAAGAGAPEG
jgi:hypothetical protein